MIGNLTDFGLEHFVSSAIARLPCSILMDVNTSYPTQGSDQIGVNHVRRFVCESLSFTHRYVPVGLLEKLPAKLNERPLPYKGRNELEVRLRAYQKCCMFCVAHTPFALIDFVGE